MINLQTKNIVFRHESYHLWEASIKSILLKNGDFIIFSKDGKKILNLGNGEAKVVQDTDGIEFMLHPLKSCNELKLEETNFLKFTNEESEMVISIQEQWQDAICETFFDDIYNVSVNTLTLRELLLLQSIFSCRQQTEIVRLIELQPEISVFIKSYLELGKRNMVQILSFDSRSIKCILDEKHSALFDSEFPVIYKLNELRAVDTNGDGFEDSEKWFKHSAIDTALANNQVEATRVML